MARLKSNLDPQLFNDATIFIVMINLCFSLTVFRVSLNLRLFFREVTLIEELLLLKEYEKREKTLSRRVAGKKNELTEILGKVSWSIGMVYSENIVLS